MANAYRLGAGSGEVRGTAAFSLSDEKPLNVSTREERDPIFLVRS